VKIYRKILILCIFSGTAIFLAGCASGGVSETPSSYGASAGVEAAKSWNEWSTEPQPSAESAGSYCADIAEEGGEIYGWTVTEIFQAADSCANSFTEELFRN
jgi:hypothetical protein